MKKLEVNQMENLRGEGGGFFTSFSCTLTVISLGAMTVASGGTAAIIAAPLAGAACGASLGLGSSWGYWP